MVPRRTRSYENKVTIGEWKAIPDTWKYKIDSLRIETNTRCPCALFVRSIKESTHRASNICATSTTTGTRAASFFELRNFHAESEFWPQRFDFYTDIIFLPLSAGRTRPVTFSSPAFHGLYNARRYLHMDATELNKRIGKKDIDNHDLLPGYTRVTLPEHGKITRYRARMRGPDLKGP